jgi:hypothetical protein
MKKQNILLVVAVFGLLVPNNLFLYWWLHDFTGWGEVVHNRLAMAFMLDAFSALGLLAYYFAERPIGPFKWYWFVALSLLGGLGFSLPLYWWLNRRGASRSEPG